jgi:site-specific DNA-cytosine methylase
VNGPAHKIAELRRASIRREFTVVGLFANIGGFELGAMRAGGVPLLANEISRPAIYVHRRNLLETVIDERNAASIAASPASTAAFLSQAGLRPGQVSCIVGGSPCNRLSSLAPRFARRGSPLDTRRLLFDHAQIVQNALPLTAVAENVAALSTRFPILLENFLDCIRFAANGERRYFALARILCASHYGTPQIRRRTITIAIRADVGRLLGIASDNAVQSLFPSPSTPQAHTIRWALQDLHLTPRELAPFRRAVAAGTLARIARRMPTHPDRVLHPHDVGFARHSYYNLERCAWDQPAPTLSAMGIMPIALSGPLHPSEQRKFALRELLRLFGAPDDFDFGFVDVHDAAQRIGLMVPPPLAEAIFLSLRDNVFRRLQAASFRDHENVVRPELA